MIELKSSHATTPRPTASISAELPAIPRVTLAREDLEPLSFHDRIQAGVEALCKQAGEKKLPGAQYLEQAIKTVENNRILLSCVQSAAQGGEGGFPERFADRYMLRFQEVAATGLSGDFMNKLMRPVQTIQCRPPGAVVQALALMAVPTLYSDYAATGSDASSETATLRNLGLVSKAPFDGKINRKNYENAAELDTLLQDISASVKEAVSIKTELNYRAIMVRLVRALELISRLDFRPQSIGVCLSSFNTVAAAMEEGKVDYGEVRTQIAKLASETAAAPGLEPFRKPEELDRIGRELDQALEDSAKSGGFAALRRVWCTE